MTRVHLRWPLIALFALLMAAALWGCRTPVVVEGNLSAEPFLRSEASLTKDSAGRLFAVTALGQQPDRFAVVDFEDQIHLFWTHRKGERAVHLLPLTRLDIDWYNRAMTRTPEIRFYDEVDDLAVATSVGFWRGGSQDNIRWLGPVPEGEIQAVVVPTEVDIESVSLADYIVGIVALTGDSITRRFQTFPPHRGPYLIIPDGAFNQQGLPRVASSAQGSFETDEVAWTWSSAVGGEPVNNSAELQQGAGLFGVDIYIANRGGDIAFGFATDAGPPGLGSRNLRPALAESGLILNAGADANSRLHVIRGIDALYSGNPLSAAFHLAQTSDWHVDGSREATLLRHQDLIAAAGYIPWTRAAIVEGKEGMGPEISLYLARAFAYEDHWRATTAHATRGGRLFGQWPAESAPLGVGRANLLRAAALLAQGDEDGAIRIYIQAARAFAAAEDPYNAALARREAALIAPTEFDFTEVADLLEGAGATYEASRTLLIGVAFLIEARDFDGARQKLEAWTNRFGSQPPIRLAMLSRSLELRMAVLAGDEVDDQSIRDQFHEAQAHNAWEAAVVAGLTWYGHSSQFGESERHQLGQTLAQANLRGGVELFTLEVDRTLGAICADVAFAPAARDAVSEISRQCRHRIERAATTPEGIASLLNGGYRYLQRGDLASARALEQFVFSRLQEERAWNLVSADSYFYRAALLEEAASSEDHGADSEASVDAIQAAFNLLRQTYAPRQAPVELIALGDQFHARGFETLTIALYRAARRAAASADRNSVEFDAALKLARSLHRGQHWSELSSMESVESPLHAARIDLYRAQADFFRNNMGSARDAQTRVLRQAREFGDLQRVSVLNLAAELAEERGDLDRAREFTEQALSNLDTLPQSLAPQEQSRVLTARTLAMAAGQAALAGDVDEGRRYIERSLTIFEELPMSTAPQVRLEVLQNAARLSADVESFDGYVADLETLFRRMPDDAPIYLRRDVLRSLAELLIGRGDHQRAREHINAVVSRGQGLSPRRIEHHYLVGLVQLYSSDFDGARSQLRRVARAGEGFAAARATLLDALADHSATANYRAGLVRHLRDELPEYEVGERARLQWMSEFAAPTVTPIPELGNQLRETFSSDQNISPDARLAAAVSYIQYLLDTGQYEEVDRVLQSESAIFYDPEVDAVDVWVRLRITSMVRQLRPFDVFRYADRALSEAPPRSDEGEAEVNYLRAVAHLQAGQYFPARQYLENARAVATESMEISQHLDELESTLDATRFGR